MWLCRRSSAVPDCPGYFILELTVESNDHHQPSDTQTSENSLDLKEHPNLHALADQLLLRARDKSNFAMPVQIILPAFDGYFAQDNIIRDRFEGSDVVAAVHKLACGDGKLSAPSPHALSSAGLASLVGFGVAALIGHEIPSSFAASGEAHRRIEHDIKCRLQLPWWQQEPPPRRLLALVDAGPHWKYYGPVFEAAKANRISLVVIEEPGHWLSEPSSSGLCERFIPLPMDDSDGQLGSRIAEVLRRSEIVVDGITASSDGVLLPTAQAAAILGLPTQPPASFLLCRDKHATRQLRTRAIQSFSVNTQDQAVQLSNDASVQYPLIVKPQHGKSSYGVAKVASPLQLVPAVSNILSEFEDSVVIESYISGPELDVNLVLCRGRLLFCEILDDFPSEGDTDNAGPSASFLESAMSSPSSLPADELAMVQALALEAVIAAGFDTGVFHVEGRVSNSTMQYEREGDYVDLRVAAQPPKLEANFVLIEVNVRPPAFCCCKASKLTYGIDFYERWMSSALKDHDRMVTLARPFSFPRLPGAQCWSHNLIFPTVKGGVFDTSIWHAMLASRSDILQHVGAFDTPWNDGDVVPDPRTGRKRFLAYFIVCSQESRRDALKTVSQLQQQIGPILAGGLV